MRKLLLGMAMTAVTTAAFANGKLTGVEWSKVGDGLRFEIKGEGLAQPKVVRAWGGKSYMLEFAGHLIGKPQFDKVEFSGVEYVQTTWFTARPPRVRFHLRLDPASKIRIDKSETGFTVWVNADETLANDKPIGKLDDSVGATGSNPIVRLVGDSLTTKVPAPLAKVEPKPEPKDGFPQAAAKRPVEKPKTVVPPKPTAIKPPVNALPMPQTPLPRPAAGRVDIEFVNTQVVQVLKAIALEGGVNIVAAPDVTESITVSLNGVTVTEALNLVTAISGLSYARVDNTFVVAKDASLLRAFGSVEAATQSRVVPIYSGQGTQVKAAVLKMLPTDGFNGMFDLILPTENITIKTEDRMNPGGSETKDQTAVTQSTEEKATTTVAKYIVIVGPSSRLDQLEKTVKMVDEQISLALGIDVPASSTRVTKSYLPKGTKASFLLASIAGGDAKNPTQAKIGNVEAFATPLTSSGRQTITLVGRENEVDKLVKMLEAMDQMGDGDKQFLIYDVKFMDPRGLKQDLETQFPNLDVALVAAAAGTPGLFKERSTQQTASGSEQSSQTQQQGSAGATEVKGDAGDLEGITLPFSSLEQQAFGMRLRIRGTEEAIQQAVAYLTQIDTAPRQIAIELRVMDISKEEALRVGIDWSMVTSGGVNIFRVNQGLGDSAGTAGSSSTGVPLPTGDGKERNANVIATLDSIANDRNLIARPNLFAYDGRQSELFVGDVIRYIESIQSNQNGITVTTKELPVGVRLAVLPRIGGDGNITMDLRPVVSTLNGFTPVPGGGQLPQTSLRIAQNTLSISDGETVAIGGLIQENDVKRESGIPILKDLPIIGKLFFSRTDNSKRRTELVFFISAKILNKENRANAANPMRDRPATGGGQ